MLHTITNVLSITSCKQHTTEINMKHTFTLHTLFTLAILVLTIGGTALLDTDIHTAIMAYIGAVACYAALIADKEAP